MTDMEFKDDINTCGTAKQEPVKNKSEKTVKLKCHVSNDIMHATILI